MDSNFSKIFRTSLTLGSRKAMSAIALATFAGLLVTGCGGSNTTTADSPSIAAPGQVYANDWTQITINANQAKTTVNASAIIETDRNKCNRPAYGAMSLKDWNSFATEVNEAMKKYVPGGPKVCVPIDPSNCFALGIESKAVIQMDNGKNIPLFDAGEYGEACTQVQDRTLAEDLYKKINGITWSADQMDCTLQWETCSR